MNLNKLLNTIDNFLLFTLLFLTPIVVSDIFAIPVDTTKLVFSATLIVLILLVKSVKLVLGGSFTFKSNRLDFPVLLIAVGYVVSGILITPNKMEAFAIPGIATGVVVATLTYFLINQLENKGKDIAQNLILATGVVIAIISLLASANLLTNISYLPAFVKNTQFTSTGSISSALVILAAVFMVGVAKGIYEKELTKKVLYSVTSLVLAFGLFVNISKFLPGTQNPPRLPSMNTTWNVAVDTLKVSPFLGIGPGNFVTAFARFKPLSYNTTDLWNTLFGFGRSHFLTLLTEGGLLTGAGMILLLLSIAKESQAVFKSVGTRDDNEHTLTYLAVTIGFGLLLFFPVNLSTLIVLFALLAVHNKTNPYSTRFFAEGQQSFASKIPAIAFTLPVLVGALLFFFTAYRIVSADIVFRKALSALSQNDAQTTYDLMREAITKNPRIDRYRLNFAQVNFAIANSMASTANDPQNPQTALTDENRATITQLIQQSINEARAAVSLNPTRADNWEALGSIYRSIASLADGAGDFALQSYSQAVSLDPINPNLRITLGSLYYAAKDYENAIASFRLATQAKPDFANSHYNLAIAYRDSDQIEKAISEIQLVLSLVEKDSKDFEVATQELANLESKRPQPTTNKNTENLTSPQSESLPTLNPPLQLDENAAPPLQVEEIQNTPTPTNTPTL